MAFRTDKVAYAACCIDLILPATPNGPIRVARVTRIRLVHKEVVICAVVVKSGAVDVVHDPSRIQKRIVLEITPVLDLIITNRQRRLLEVFHRVYSPLDSTIPEVPVVIAIGVVGI